MVIEKTVEDHGRVIFGTVATILIGIFIMFFGFYIVTYSDAYREIFWFFFIPGLSLMIFAFIFLLHNIFVIKNSIARIVLIIFGSLLVLFGTLGIFLSKPSERTLFIIIPPIIISGILLVLIGLGISGRDFKTPPIAILLIAIGYFLVVFGLIVHSNVKVNGSIVYGFLLPAGIPGIIAIILGTNMCLKYPQKIGIGRNTILAFATGQIIMGIIILSLVFVVTIDWSIVNGYPVSGIYQIFGIYFDWPAAIWSVILITFGIYFVFKIRKK